MTQDLLLFLIYISLFLILGYFLGKYMAKVFNKEKTIFDPIMLPLEKMIYRLAGINPEKEMNWKEYSKSLLLINAMGIGLLFVLQLIQGFLPLNPQGFGMVKPDLAFNTAVSFVTNTNWQAYSGESTLSYFTQMTGMTVQNFLSAATGIVVAIALIRGIARHQVKDIGNFWVDLTRCTLWILLPISFVFALVLVSQGVIQNLSPYLTLENIEGFKQTLAMGPVASQEAIKQFGTNGGGFFNANSAHPFENPTALSNFLELLAVLVIPAGLTFTFGRMVGNKKQGYVILGTMLILFVLFLGICYTAEIAGNPLLTAQGISQPTAMEGKEVRFGIGQSSLFAVVTTAASCGAVNNMHDSLTPLGGLVPMVQIMLGEVVFGGVGSGLYGMLMFVILTVFIIGLMVGRTPEYLGKKIESPEMKMAIFAVLIPSITILLGSAIAVVTKDGVSSILNPGPHGLSEILYGFASAAGNNGSAFAGLSANTLFYNISLAIAMLLGRFGVIIPALAIAGSLAAKKTIPQGPGTFQTTGVIFPILLTGTVLLVGALTFFPALSLGPIVEYFLMLAGRTF
ncbi:potassium-transporting ATPase subunit KdpA [Dehalobacter sp. DCM]|uniref:potassium-transporting ATPase subunit KdpA n=1 Tax=Dehalobacter sp. DCM TaxID=2907827 RepID=UPI0030818619|nr:potassium-transporting ATPase subunit KdpA [Dehalobacter sp. DCM]